MQTGSICNRELSLSEIFADPIVQTMMVRDGVTRSDLERLIRSIRRTRVADDSPARS